MKYLTTIDNVFALSHGLNLSEAAVLDWLISHNSTDGHMALKGKIYYLSDRQRACDQLPMVTEKPDTMYRHYRSLQRKGLIEVIKWDRKDYVYLCPETKLWR